jgi:CRP-like cAMP-binding protein
MSKSTGQDTRPQNRILRSLSKAEWDVLRPQMTPITWKLSDIIYKEDEPIEDVFFVESGLASIVSQMSSGGSVEVSLVGRDGMLGTAALLGAKSTPHRTFTQVAGHGYRVKASIVQDAFDNNGNFKTAMRRYVQALFVQAAQGGACNRLHLAEERLARWLLTSADRLGVNPIPLTQEFLATMLGSRRSTVTVAAGILQKAGYIRYSRGKITILDRKGLESSACECYQIIRDEFDDAALLK